MTNRLSTGALAITRHGFLQGGPDSHWSWMSVRGTRALAESARAAGERSWSVRVRAEGWTRGAAVAHEDERVPPPFVLNGQAVERRDEGTVRILQGFKATVERGESDVPRPRSSATGAPRRRPVRPWTWDEIIDP